MSSSYSATITNTSLHQPRKLAELQRQHLSEKVMQILKHSLISGLKEASLAHPPDPTLDEGKKSDSYLWAI